MLFRVHGVVTDGVTAKRDVRAWHSDLSMAEVVGSEVPVPKIAEEVLRHDAERRARPGPCTCPPLRPRAPVTIRTERDWYRWLSRNV